MDRMKRTPLLWLVLALLMMAALPAAWAAPEEEGDTLEVMPIAEAGKCCTYRGARVQGQLHASDPDGGVLTFEIVEHPKKGTVTLEGEDGASFVYTPNEGKTGRDSFTFCAKDEDGNISEPAEVKMEILRPRTEVRYGDMADNAAHAASIRLAEEGVFTGRRVGDTWFFDPDTPVSRGEFLAMAMAAAGEDAPERVTVTGFSDDAAIPTWAKAYATQALNSGVISGKMEGGRVVFSADAPVSESEAAAILNRLMAVTDVDAEPFAGKNVPAWAVQSVANLSSVRVMKMEADGSAVLDRAAAAEMLCAAMDLMDRKNGGFFAHKG